MGVFSLVLPDIYRFSVFGCFPSKQVFPAMHSRKVFFHFSVEKIHDTYSKVQIMHGEGN